MTETKGSYMLYSLSVLAARPHLYQSVERSTLCGSYCVSGRMSRPYELSVMRPVPRNMRCTVRSWTSKGKFSSSNCSDSVPLNRQRKRQTPGWSVRNVRTCTLSLIGLISMSLPAFRIVGSQMRCFTSSTDTIEPNGKSSNFFSNQRTSITPSARNDPTTLSIFETEMIRSPTVVTLGAARQPPFATNSSEQSSPWLKRCSCVLRPCR